MQSRRGSRCRLEGGAINSPSFIMADAPRGSPLRVCTSICGEEGLKAGEALDAAVGEAVMALAERGSLRAMGLLDLAAGRAAEPALRETGGPATA